MRSTFGGRLTLYLVFGDGFDMVTRIKCLSEVDLGVGEGFGIVFLEALANGLTVIGGNKDGSTDPLMDGKLGILVDPYDNHQIKKGITDVLSGKINSKLYDKNYLTHEVVENFGFNRFSQNLYDVLNSNI